MNKNNKKQIKKIGDYRSLGRELAVQFIFQTDISGESLTRESLNIFWEQLEESACFPNDGKFHKAVKFAEKIITGTNQNLGKIDETMTNHSSNWRIDRMGGVERNIIRVATYEMLFEKSVPPIVSINEALNLAKKFCDKDSSPFINGILNAIMNSLERPARVALEKN